MKAKNKTTSVPFIPIIIEIESREELHRLKKVLERSKNEIGTCDLFRDFSSKLLLTLDNRERDSNG